MSEPLRVEIPKCIKCGNKMYLDYREKHLLRTDTWICSFCGTNRRIKYLNKLVVEDLTIDNNGAILRLKEKKNER